MDTLRIHRLTARYHLPASAREERSRLDRVLQQALDEVLEAALERAGIPTHEEICVRELHVPVRLRLASPDASLAVAWSLAITETLQAVLASGEGVVRYGSRHHALVDVALGATRGEWTRAWAWRQLGLWRPAGTPSEAEAVREAVHALVAEPRAIVPVVMEMARAGALPRFVALAREEGCLALARAALTGFSAPVALAIPAPSAERAPAPPAELEHRASRVLRASAIAQAVTRPHLDSPGGAGSLRALAVLSVLEVEPTAFRQSPRAGATLLAEVEHRLGSPRPGEAPPPSTPPRPGQPEPAGAAARERARPREEPCSPDEESAPVRALRDTKASHPAPAHARASSEPEPVDVPETRASTEASSGVPEVRHRATTRAAGLLFLLHLVDELGLPDTLLAHEAAASRGLRWLLHQLALGLQPLEPEDPAVLAFAGLPPGAPPPSKGEPPPTEAEHALLEACATRVVERLRERLGQPDTPRERLLLSVCRRRGEVVADPGWLEVRLALDEISTEVRRAGLDLNPDWLPWLGVVVRFVYA